jgi:hypothetical protein
MTKDLPRASTDPAPGQPDRGFVNPPTAPEQPARNPEEMAAAQGAKKPEAAAPDALDAMDKDQLKALAGLLGVNAGARPRDTTFRTAIRAHVKAAGKTVDEAIAERGVKIVEPGVSPLEQQVINERELVQVDAEFVGETVRTETREVVEQPAEERGFTLYVNCAPQDTSFGITFAQLVGVLNEHLHTKKGVRDYRMIPYTGAAELCLAYLDMCEDAEAAGGSLHGDIVVDARTPEGSVLLETISAHAMRVIRGF